MIMIFMFELICKINQFQEDSLHTKCCENILALLFVLKDTFSKDSVVSAWQLLIDESVLHRIKNVQMLKMQLGEEAWSISIQEREAFVSLLHGREAYVARNLSVNILW
jgi:hypothetical protein